MQIKEFKIYDVGEEAIINDYPYGFRGKCVLKAVIEETKNGQRTKTTTIFNGRENNPKYSTYNFGSFFLTKEGRLYRGSIRKEDNKTSVEIYNYSGDYNTIATFDLEEVKELIPQRILKPFLDDEKVNEVIGKIWEKVHNESKDIYNDKTEEQIKDFILNPDNWNRSGGGYYSKDGFYKRDAGHSYFDGKNYNASVNVSFSCGFISHSFDVDNLEELRLTEKNKKMFEEKARIQLVEFLRTFPREKIEIDMEQKQTTLKINDSYSTTQL